MASYFLSQRAAVSGWLFVFYFGGGGVVGEWGVKEEKNGCV